MSTLERDLYDVYSELIDLILKKNKDYGSAYKAQGLVGVLIRIMDKINRATNISKNKIEIKSESLDDTIRDLMGYCSLYLIERANNSKV